MDMQTDRKIDRFLPLIGLFALALMGAGAFAAYRLQQAYLIRKAQTISDQWPSLPGLTASIMIDRYGPPDHTGVGSMVWYGRAPWKRVIVYADRRRGPLEETVAYSLDARRADAISAFGRGVTADPMDSELSAKGEDESSNFLALNLADEVATGARKPAEARRIYDNTKALAASGKSSAYNQGLLFEPSATFLPEMLK